MSAPNESLDPKSNPPVDTPEQLEGGTGQDQAQETELQAQEDWATLLSEAQEKVALYHDELLRAKADVENIRRRAADDVAKARKFGTESFAESLIPVRDSLEAALAQTGQTAESWKDGVEVTLRQLNAAFERNLLREVAPVPGDIFDPHRHQAISTVPSDLPEDTVAQLLQKGYTIADRVLRPALVMVSAGKSAQES
ncbi:nucleotide exchange factor GrpE [Pollutimonas nitritireducens]|uniref:Protein GrpE n=1 Tax=Pollutimonas nitritireducens TaxID=2045209 RepID=A0A2N4UDE2_9BURK|nr:nucleotide exchange factor GrpE [Pollutimonas nitritireducens]PLC53023.1 nucleotide exchange factor GrpE [Pollutimonas nitritireducens]